MSNPPPPFAPDDDRETTQPDARPPSGLDEDATVEVPLALDGTPLAPVEDGGADETSPVLRLGADDLRAAEVPSLRAPFVGRQPLLRQILGIFAACRETNRLQIVTVVGDPGGGKTRLAEEVCRAALRDAPDTSVLRGASGGPDAPPYGAIAAAFADHFGAAGDAPSATRARIAEAVAEVVASRFAEEVTHLLAQLIGVPFPESPIVEPLAQSPHQLEVRTFIAARRYLAGRARRGPLLIVIDDLHDAAASTVNMVHYLAEALSETPTMILATAGPDLGRAHPRWGEGDHATRLLALPPLTPAEAAALFSALIRVDPPPPDLLATARDALGGNARAVSDLARYALEAGIVVPSPGGWRVDEARLAAAPLPRNHEGILRARLDALPADELRVLDCASVVGDVFWLDAVVTMVRASLAGGATGEGPDPAQRAADRSREEVADLLGRLAARKLVERLPDSSIPGAEAWRFAYDPVRRLAYDRVTPEVRQQRHALVAQWLDLAGEAADGGRDALVAEHLLRAGLRHRAAVHFQRAARHARDRYDNPRAIALFGRALATVEPADIATRIHLWHDIGSVHQLVGAFDEALAAFERMARLAWLVASRPKAAVAANKRGRVHRARGDMRRALAFLEEALSLFRQAGDQRGVAMTLDDIGQTYRMLGRYQEALDRAAEALEIRRRLGDRRSIASSLTNVGVIEQARGLYAEAAACYAEALSLRRALGDDEGIVFVENCMGALAYERGDPDEARDHWMRALAGAERIGSLPMQAFALNNLGEAAARQGRLADARQRLERGLTLARKVEDARAEIEILRNLSLVDLAEGDGEQARQRAELCLERAEALQLKEMIAQAHLTLATVHAATLFDTSGDGESASRAEEHLLRAIATFREMGNEAELARALRRLGELQAERGSPAAGRATLRQAAQLYDRLGLPGREEVHQMIRDLS